SECFVAWRPGNGGPSIISAKVVADDGTTDASAPQPLSEVPVYAGPWLATTPAGYAVAWVTYPRGRESPLVVQWRVAGGKINSLPEMAGNNVTGGAAIAAIGTRIVLAYARVDDAAGSVARVFVNSVTPPRHRAAR